MYSNVACGYGCVFVCTACAVMLCAAIAGVCVYSMCSNVMCGYSCVFVCAASAVILCVAIAVCLCVQRVQYFYGWL